MLPQEEQCPVDDSLLGDLYRASPEKLHDLLGTISPGVRAALALYCHKRAHLTELSVAIASTCELADMVSVGGMAGRALFAKSRAAPVVVAEKRSKITLSTGPLSYVIAQDLI
jgi:hypothetical protein